MHSHVLRGERRSLEKYSRVLRQITWLWGELYPEEG
jgi:hypothetical protein